MSDDPNDQPGRLDARTRDLLALRTTLARELDTINEYERMIHDAGSPEVKALLAHLRDEEKEHVAECMEFIRRLDAVQDRFFGEDVSAHLGGKPRGQAGPAPRPEMQRGFTVGSLRIRKD